MAVATLSQADLKLRDGVFRQLQWDPEVDAGGIGVTADDGAVTLSGFIDTYAGKLAAERAAKRVRGVRAVANELEVRLRHQRADDEIARDAARALIMRTGLPDSIQAAVHHGHVTLTGHVPTLFQRVAAEVAIRHVKGIRGIANRITVTPVAAYRDVRHRIAEALHRIADVNARHIDVAVHGSTVTLTGQVTTWAQRDAAERAAAGAPGITAVDNLIEVTPGAF
jgi:osmotically-inducible protein OsmY